MVFAGAINGLLILHASKTKCTPTDTLSVQYWRNKRAKKREKKTSKNLIGWNIMPQPRHASTGETRSPKIALGLPERQNKAQSKQTKY